MKCYLQIVGADTGDAVPSVLIYLDSKSIIINAGEGIQRFFNESHLRLRKVHHACFTRVAESTVGGLPGVMLTLSDLGGVSNLRLHGPRALHRLLFATRHFVHESRTDKMSIDVHSLDDDNTLSLVEVLSDPELTLQAIVLHQNLPVLNNNAPMTTDSCAKALDDVFCCDAADVDDDEPVAKREKVSEASLPPATPFQRSVISYIGTALVPAKFDPKKAIALGVPRGPLFGRLTKGETITLSNGKIINPADVMDIDALSPRFAVLDCPSQECFDQLIAHSAFSEDSLTYVPMSCCIHYTPQELFDTDHYQSFLHRFGPNCKHILVNRHAFCDAPPMYRSAHINHLKLNAVDPDIFPLYASSDSLSVQHKPMPSNCFRAENLLRFAMSPVKDIGFDRCDIPMPIDIEAEVSSVLQANSEYSDAMTALQSNLSASKMIAHPLDRFQRDNAPEIVFLGTGSAIPSKYRNVSSTFLRIDAETCILLDCGEGTLGQLRLQFGVDQQTRCLDDHVDTLSSSSSSATSPAESLSGLDQMLFQLSAIFISHMHADHHLGLQSILCARERLRHALKSKNDGNDTMQDMLVIGPSQLLPFLCDFQSSLAQPLRFHFIDNASIQSPTHGSSALLLNRLHVSLFRTVRVFHCRDSFALVMATTDSPQTVSFKLVFSGDCRPCDALIVAGQGATVLIHEATFEDSMMAEALAKRHTTVGEAVQVGMKINAERILLTHFSQRYPKVPTLAPDAHAESSSVIAQENANIQASDSIKSDSVTDERLQRVCIAFDCMCVSFRHLRTAPFLLAPFQALFPDEQGGSESQLT